MKTLLTPPEVIRLAFADGEYLPPSAITLAEIAAAEHRYIVPVIGQALHAKLLDGSYAPFAAEFIAPATAWFTRLSIQSRLDLHTDRSGTTAPRTADGQPANHESLHRLRVGLRTQARTLLRRASDYLATHADDFPEYDPAADRLNRCSIEGGVVLVGRK